MQIKNYLLFFTRTKLDIDTF